MKTLKQIVSSILTEHDKHIQFLQKESEIKNQMIDCSQRQLDNYKELTDYLISNNPQPTT